MISVCHPLLTSSLLVLGAIAYSTASALADDRPRVFITDSESWEIAGSAAGSGGTFAASTRGGARPQTAEIIKTFGERCQEVLVNNKQEKADYVVVLDHEGGKGYLRRRNKIAVFNKDGDAIVSRSTRSLGNSVQDACGAIVADWTGRHATGISQSQVSPQPSAPTGDRRLSQPGVPAVPKNTVSVAPIPVTTKTNASPDAATLEISSSPAGADIEVDGEFRGSTPSSISVGPGEHTVGISRKGFVPWERKIKTSAGNVRIVAELETNLPSAASTETSGSPSEQQVPQASPESLRTLQPVAMTRAEASRSPMTKVPEATAGTSSGQSAEGEGTASITSNLDAAEIFVDSVGRGSAPSLLKLPAGKHRIQLVANGYKDWVAEIEVRNGSIVNVTGNLEK
jgi:hypothetical protein